MGRPRTVRPVTIGSSRRDFFKRSSAAAAAVAGTSLVTLGSANAAVARRVLFQHGIASGDPLADRVILWTRVSPTSLRSTVVVEHAVAADPEMQNIVARGRTRTSADTDFTVKVDVAGLRPSTTYYYQFTAQGEASDLGRTKTLPVGPATSLRAAVVSCSNFAYGYFNVYRLIAKRSDLDMVVHLGDYLYEYGSGQYGNVRACEPSHEIVSLDDYRARHAQYKRDADSQAMHRQHPLVAIWDDHEAANNSYRDGAENHTPATEGDWSARVTAALQAYYEWMPVREVDTATPRRNYRSYAFGNLVDLILLEERLGARSQQLGTNIGNASGYFVQSGAYLDPARQMLGSDEEAWLADRLRQSTATWKVLGQGVMFAQLKAVGASNAAGGGVYINSDQWDGYQPARDRVYRVIEGDAQHAPVNNVVVLTGDIHSSWAADLTPDPNNPIVAAGGYDPVSGAGSRAVEFVGTSVSSPGITDPSGAVANSLKPANPHFKYINLDKRGYMLVDANAQRCVCEWWHVDTVASLSNIETFAIAFETREGENRLRGSVQTPNRPGAPKLAP